MPLFCPECRGLLARRVRAGKVEQTCGKCGWAEGGRAPPRARAPAPPPASAPGADLPTPLARLFPHREVREGQRDFLLDAWEAVKAKQHLLANAPTGIGKTVSSLVAALAVARATRKRVFFLTSKQSQHRIVIETLAAMRESSGEPLVVADLIAKQDMCPRPEAQALNGKAFAEFCRREQSTKSCDHFRNALASERGVALLRSRILHVEAAVTALDRLRICPHQATLDTATQADVVVCDYNLLFSDMRAGIQERLQVNLADVVLVVDEAHNLADRIRDHLTLELNGRLLDEAEEEVRQLDGVALERLLKSVRAALDRLVEEVALGEKPDALVPRERWVDGLNEELRRTRALLADLDYDKLARAVTQAAVDYEKKEKAPPRGLSRLAQFLDMWKIERRGLARVLGKDRYGEWTLAYKLLDPAILAKPVFDGVGAGILMSGTLHPCEAARDVLGLEPDRSRVALYPSPFPPENRLVLADTTVTTKYDRRGPEMYARIADNLGRAAEAVPGHVAAFFPSYAFLQEVRHRLDVEREVILEERGLDKKAKEALVERLRRSRRAVLLLGVQGGSLSEGYDYEDNLLKGVAIVGLPLAPPSLEVEKLIEYYTGKFGPRGRDYAYTFPAMNRVMQAAGRLIRGPTDRGVVLLMDERFTWSNYRACFPPELSPRPTKDPASEVRRFFAAQG